VAIEPVRVQPQDDELLAQFSCWDGTPQDPWAEEVENHIRSTLRRRILHDAHYTLLAWYDAGQLVGLSAYLPDVVGIPANRPVDEPCLHLDLVAVRRDLQRKGYGLAILDCTLEHMAAADPTRLFVTARVHVRNHAGYGLCKARDIDLYRPEDDPDYCLLLKEVSPGQG
jgi:GNAT superfamily N-acetyltransferase